MKTALGFNKKNRTPEDSPGFNLPRTDEPAAQPFLYNGFDLPESGRFHFEVVARNCFGAESRPIRSGVFAPRPGMDRAR